MKKDAVIARNIDEFISVFPTDIQAVLNKLRSTILKAAPRAEEGIKYGIPTFIENGVSLVHFSAYKTHIGFYPTPSGIVAFRNELSKYETSKGTVQFPIDKPLPFTLIAQIVKFRVLENQEKSKAKPKKRSR